MHNQNRHLESRVGFVDTCSNSNLNYFNLLSPLRSTCKTRSKNRGWCPLQDCCYYCLFVFTSCYNAGKSTTEQVARDDFVKVMEEIVRIIIDRYCLCRCVYTYVGHLPVLCTCMYVCAYSCIVCRSALVIHRIASLLDL